MDQPTANLVLAVIAGLALALSLLNTWSRLRSDKPRIRVEVGERVVHTKARRPDRHEQITVMALNVGRIPVTITSLNLVMASGRVLGLAVDDGHPGAVVLEPGAHEVRGIRRDNLVELSQQHGGRVLEAQAVGPIGTWRTRDLGPAGPLGRD